MRETPSAEETTGPIDVARRHKKTPANAGVLNETVTHRSAVVNRTMRRVMMARRRTVIRAVMHSAMVVVVVVDRTMVHRVVHDDHATRLRHRQCRRRQGRNSQCHRNDQLLHEIPCGLNWVKHGGCRLNCRRRRAWLHHASLAFHVGARPSSNDPSLGTLGHRARAYSSMVRAEDS